jgi:hypothetical protein
VTPAPSGPLRAGIVVYTSHGLPALRAVLRGIRDTVEEPHDLAVVCPECAEQVATYLVRQYLRGRLDACELEHGARPHCGLDRAFQLARGDYLVRVDDTLEFRPGWLEKAIGVLEAEPSIGCLSLVAPPDYHRRRGRPATVHVKPEACERLDMRCYVTRRSLVEAHECDLMAQRHDACRFQSYLAEHGLTLAYLPGVVSALDQAQVPRPSGGGMEAELPPHEGATGAVQRLEQQYELGDEVLLTCMACGAPELDVLAARIQFCRPHQVAVGYWYELRCPECGELHYKDDFQFRCPE